MPKITIMLGIKLYLPKDYRIYALKNIYALKKDSVRSYVETVMSR